MDVEHIEQWLGTEVVDLEGEKVGKLEEVHFRGTEPVVAEIKAGRLSRKRVLVPLRGASASREWVRVGFPAGSLLEHKSSGDVVDAAAVQAIAEHYGEGFAAEAGGLEGSRARAERLAAEAEAARAEAEAEEARRRADEADPIARGAAPPPA